MMGLKVGESKRTGDTDPLRGRTNFEMIEHRSDKRRGMNLMVHAHSTSKRKLYQVQVHSEYLLFQPIVLRLCLDIFAELGSIVILPHATDKDENQARKKSESMF